MLDFFVTICYNILNFTERRSKMFFRKKNATGNKPRVVAFVDYEHWYISLDKKYKTRPDIKAWRDMLSERYHIADILFFGDFSNPSLRAEIPKIREVSNMIIETQNATAHYKKDFTDFIMLDHIYQRAIETKENEAFVIFSGDGHFSSVVSYLVTKCRREVGVYGIKGALSSQLKGSATYAVELPTEETIRKGYQSVLYHRVADMYEQKKNPRPTFRATAQKAAEECGCDEALMSELLNDLVDKQIIGQRRIYIGQNRSIKILTVNREKAAEYGLVE